MTMRYYQFLTEAQNYSAMFGALAKLQPPGVNVMKSVEFQIKRAKEIFQRKNDRMVWFLRHVRYWAALTVKEAYEQYLRDAGSSPEAAELKANLVAVERLMSRYAVDLGEDTERYQSSQSAGSTIRVISQEFAHFLSLNIPAIQNYVFHNQSISQITNAFSDAEKTWQAEQSQMFPHEEEDIVIQFPDGMAWVNLQRAYCDKEAKSMGHCGNAPRSETKDTILSLRKVIEQNGRKFWHPFLTFILNDAGELTEMKGRSNDKPAKRYHPYIIALLRNNIVKGIRGGGYLSQNNFSLSDLPKEEAEALIAEKPDLMSPYYKFETEGLTPENAAEIIATFSSDSRHYLEYDPETRNILITDYIIEDEASYFIDEYLGPEDELANWSYVNSYDREGFLEAVASIVPGATYDTVVNHLYRSLTDKQRDEIAKLVNTKGAVQPDLFGGPAQVSFGLPPEELRYKEEHLIATGEFEGPIAEVSKYIGWKRIKARIDDYTRNLMYLATPYFMGLHELPNGKRCAALSFHDFYDILGEDSDAEANGDTFDRNFEIMTNGDHQGDISDSSIWDDFDFELPVKKSNHTGDLIKDITPKRVYEAFMASFVEGEIDDLVDTVADETDDTTTE